MTIPTQAIAPVLVRILTRYGNALLAGLSIGTAAAGLPVLDDPDVQIVLTLVVNAVIALVTESAWLKARANGGPT